DEAMVRDLCCTILERAGYQVLVAEDGRQALAVYEREQASIDLVLLDQTMPHLSGRDTLRQLQQINPAVRIIIASGYSTADSEHPPAEGIVGRIPKPYRKADLLARVRAALEADKPTT